MALKQLNEKTVINIPNSFWKGYDYGTIEGLRAAISSIGLSLYHMAKRGERSKDRKIKFTLEDKYNLMEKIRNDHKKYLEDAVTRYIPVKGPALEEVIDFEGFEMNSYYACDDNVVKDFGGPVYFVNEEWLMYSLRHKNDGKDICSNSMA